MKTIYYLCDTGTLREINESIYRKSREEMIKNAKNQLFQVHQLYKYQKAINKNIHVMKISIRIFFHKCDRR